MKKSDSYFPDKYLNISKFNNGWPLFDQASLKVADDQITFNFLKYKRKIQFPKKEIAHNDQGIKLCNTISPPDFDSNLDVDVTMTKKSMTTRLL